ncbi:hypothetical protein DCCM_3053 [Desulfocucumis palustris]|uniref:Uncharacterized protein n=1 Tax=Desulfocucumis palustris TaxID=1898651 RepID=A0A2L2XCU3_9FIRM|nr:hypothetical protein DCCM_3053 [Desulfocucumis palustris]
MCPLSLIACLSPAFGDGDKQAVSEIMTYVPVSLISLCFYFYYVNKKYFL